MTYFNNCNNLDELKAVYRRLTLKYHPDVGGDVEIMKEINVEYEIRFEVLKAARNAAADADNQTTETPDEYREIILALLRMDGLVVELCGSWLWITGETLQHKDELKRIGCHWSASKRAWTWHHAEPGAKRYHGTRTMGEIRRRYGSTVYGAAARHAVAVV